MEDLRHIMPFLVPISFFVLIMAVVMGGIYFDYQKKVRIFELHHKERIMAIERGMEVPPLPAEFFSKTRRPEEGDLRQLSLRRGLQWLLLGLAVGIALLINHGIEAATWALLPISFGLAYLIYYKVGALTAKAP